MSVDGDHPEGLLYHEEHDWVLLDGDTALFGVTWHAQDALGDLVHFDPPDVGDTVIANESYGELESVKAVSDVIAPMDGVVLEVNGEVAENPELINDDPYAAWLIRVRLGEPSQADGLMSADEYARMLDDAG